MLDKIENPIEEAMEQEEENEEGLPEDVEPVESPVGDSDRMEMSKCTRFEVCGNLVYGSTCPQCYKDIREQLEVEDCEECGNNTFKYRPSGKRVGLECEECGYTDVQTVEYTGEANPEDSWRKAAQEQ